MKNFFSMILMMTSLQSFASISDFKFDVNYHFTLYPKGTHNFVEYQNTRLSKAKLNIDLLIGEKKESHTVKLGLNDLNKGEDLLKVRTKKNRASLIFKGSQYSLKLNKSSQVPVSLQKLGEYDLIKTLRNVDKDLTLNEFSQKLVKNSLACKPSRKYLLCEVSLSYKGSRKAQTSKISQLKGHLEELKSEMALNSSDHYDIQGYREFLNKAENLLDESLKAPQTHKQDSKEKLLAVKDLLINERIDSYEYTAIRSKSIASFVNLLISKI